MLGDLQELEALREKELRLAQQKLSAVLTEKDALARRVEGEAEERGELKSALERECARNGRLENELQKRQKQLQTQAAEFEKAKKEVAAQHQEDLNVSTEEAREEAVKTVLSDAADAPKMVAEN